jgi:hypothetical protein
MGKRVPKSEVTKMINIAATRNPTIKSDQLSLEFRLETKRELTKLDSVVRRTTGARTACICDLRRLSRGMVR